MRMNSRQTLYAILIASYFATFSIACDLVYEDEAGGSHELALEVIYDMEEPNSAEDDRPAEDLALNFEKVRALDDLQARDRATTETRGDQILRTFLPETLVGCEDGTCLSIDGRVPVSYGSGWRGTEPLLECTENRDGTLSQCLTFEQPDPMAYQCNKSGVCACKGAKDCAWMSWVGPECTGGWTCPTYVPLTCECYI